MNSSLTPLLFADLSHLPWVAIIAVGGGLIIGPVIIFIIFKSIERRHQQWHETARVALEKGQPPPPMPADMATTATEEKSKPADDIRAGLILIAVGVGLYLFLEALVSRALGLVGAIPGLIGVALLGFGIASALMQPKDPPSA